MNTARSSLTVLTLVAATALALGACAASKPQDSAASPSAAASTPSPSASIDTVPTVPGYRPGEIPPVPLFTVPSMDVFASNADKAVIDTASSLQSVPGITVSPAKCDGNVLVSGSTVFGGDGSASTMAVTAAEPTTTPMPTSTSSSIRMEPVPTDPELLVFP